MDDERRDLDSPTNAWNCRPAVWLKGDLAVVGSPSNKSDVTGCDALWFFGIGTIMCDANSPRSHPCCCCCCCVTHRVHMDVSTTSFAESIDERNASTALQNASSTAAIVVRCCCCLVRLATCDVCNSGSFPLPIKSLVVPFRTLGCCCCCCYSSTTKGRAKDFDLDDCCDIKSANVPAAVPPGDSGPGGKGGNCKRMPRLPCTAILP